MLSLELPLAFLAVAGACLAWWYRAQLRAAWQRHERELADQREQREMDLKAQATRTASLFDRMVEGILVLGPTGRIRLANTAAGNLFGFAPPAVGRSVMEATRRHEVAALVNRLEREPEVLSHELCLDGLASSRYLQVNALALRGAAGNREGAILVFHDLTRIRELEAIRQEFVANVSHELRTPLSLIKSAAETLIDGGRRDEAVTTRFLDIIDRHASRLTFLIDDLLLLSRLDSGRIQLELERVALHDVAQEALEDAVIVARSKEIALVNDVPPGLLAMADLQRFRQVLGNLIDNAIKYGHSGGRVTLWATRRGPQVEFSVKDDGPGIPLEAQERIFERFFRVDKARAREHGGTGLWLSIVKNVIQAHGGEVWVKSVPPHGADFRFTLAAATSEAATTRPAGNPAAPGPC